ncbi:cytochrome d ubiquinol oxidase subunit II [Pectinatus brassicae]|uniref:Cytochrome d ubiquinol oxidase subunit II n=1 Tax=Pectinatus brassicae TaxID=862415 RepID=A0A840UJ53_9FIRM|nr:cytochrome d ubiquinol oxidase subunit II [Pectinatus brassicae]MBB5336220.1 cytochrome d ubiquinol oxidase subunit II [Pectinatus brassicae]
MELQIIWFILVTVLFTGFFFLEGFDYGVGILLPFVAKNDLERRMFINSIGPVWDGNEVWMITAGGAMFAAFPHVYATMFSMFYMALFLMLVGLIVRGVSFEFRGQHDSDCWRKLWDNLIFVGSILPAFLWGVAVANLMKGFMINSDKIYMGTFWDLLSVYTLVGGITFVLVFAFHGITYLSLKIDKESVLLPRLRLVGTCLGGTAAIFYLICMAMTYADTDMYKSSLSLGLMVLAAIVFVLAIIARYYNRCIWAFTGSSLAIICTTAAVFAGLFPRILISTMNPEWSLTVTNASSSPYTLSIMTVAAFIFVPIVLIYQGWVYWIFRKRVTAKDLKY